jgi:hypothetical protein
MRHVLMLALVAALVACVTTRVEKTTTDVPKPRTGATVVLVEPDVTVGSLKATGLVEARADWTAAAKANIERHIQAQLSGKAYRVVPFNARTSPSPRVQQIFHLHEAVGDSMVSVKLGGLTLPTKKDVFDWSLGTGVQEIGRPLGADYALFVYATGTYADTGRVMTMLVMAALFGAAVPLGRQVAFASLVDLNTGNILWFNVTQTGEVNDMTKDGGAAALVRSLLKDMPL